MPAHKFHDGHLHFVTTTVVNWIDLFTRADYAHTVVESLKICQEEKGLEIYAWVIMSNHLHMIVGAKEGYRLSNIFRDFKQYTSRKIIRQIRETPESRSAWLLDMFATAANNNPKVRHYQLWQAGNHPKVCLHSNFTLQKLHYIHLNPVRAQIVRRPEDYVFSSAIDYAGGEGLIQVKLLPLSGLRTGLPR